ncbi:MAG: Fic family protein [Myxococcaceae bacterium]|nr:Fic family protein [Myxococcaceae bacterium]
MTPPFKLTLRMLTLASQIERRVGRAEGLELQAPQPLLRKRSRVRTIAGSTAIEGNTLTEEQVTALLEGKRVIGDRREVLEVTNANAAYDAAPGYVAHRQRDLLAAHRVLMKGLVERAGRFRTGNVGVMQGSKVAHVAPPPRLVKGQVEELLGWVRDAEVPLLIRSCVAHYELLFIHPFIDGNGRLARLWQHVALLQASPVYRFVPIESVIRERQKQYYAVLRKSDRAGDCTAFVEYVLEALRDALDETLAALRPTRPRPDDRLELAREHFGTRWFTRGDYLQLHRTIGTATASRDLLDAAEERVLEKRGERRFTRYRFARSS